MPSLTIVIPVFNEVELLAPSLKQIRAALSPHFAPFDLILVESGSTDGTGELCDRLASEHGDVRVIHEGRRNGFGSALRIGYAAATGELVSMITADQPFPLTAYRQALPYLAEHDCVLSYRSHDPRGPYRRFQSWVFNLLARWMLGLRVRHVNSAFKICRRDVIEQLRLTENGWLFDAQLVARLERQHIPYAEIPVPFTDRTAGTSSLGFSTPFRMLRQLVALSRSL